MKKLKQLTLSPLLVLVLAASAFAGIISTPAPPPPPAAASSATTPGEIWIPGDGHNPGSPIDSATVAVLNLLQSLLSVF